MEIKTTVVNDTLYGFKVIGGSNSHYRYQSKDGTKHRSLKEGIAHQHQLQVNRLCQRWGCTLTA